MAKTIPVVGSAFLGNDPLVPRILKVTFGVSSAVVDVVATAPSTAASGAAYDELVNFADSGYLITGMRAEIIEAFTAAGLNIGQDSIALEDGIGCFLATGIVANVVGVYDAHTMDTLMSLTPEAQWGTDFQGDSELHFFMSADSAAPPWPIDSDDTLRAIFDSGTCVASVGKMALFIEYQAL